VIKATAGKDEPERCNQAFTVAAAAVASGVTTSLWLTGEAAWFSLPGRAADFSLPHAAPLPDLLASVLALGTVTVCTQCAARRDIAQADVIDGIRIAGAATFVAEVMADGAQALVYLAGCLLSGADRCQAFLAESVGQLFGLRGQRGQLARGPEQQQVGEARVADERRAVQVAAEHAAGVCALGAVAVAGSQRGAGQRPGARA